MTQSSSLIGTGLVLGVAHVFTGPDHLSAVATLSASVDSRLHAFCLGVRWGLGHSSGLLLVGVILILIDNHTEGTIEVPERLSHAFELLVGIFMILLGSYGLWRARLKFQKGYSTLERPLDPSDSLEPGEDIEQDHEAHRNEENSVHDNEVEGNEGVKEESDEQQACCTRCVSKISTNTMAFSAGIIHGLAGPGGVLGVIPAVQLHDGRLAFLYLSFFCASSIVSMGVFALCYGSCSSKLGRYTNREYLIEGVSAVLCIFVGIMWIILVSIGKMEAIFP